MWIFDSYHKAAWNSGAAKEDLSGSAPLYPPSFYMHLKDPHAYWEMVQALESRFRVEECSFNSIFGTFEGHRIYASRKVAEKSEIQTRYAAELYNVDVRQDQARALAKERGILLYELREPGDETNQSDRIKCFEIIINEYIPVFNDIKIIQDSEWNLQELKRLKVPLSEASKIQVEISDNLKFYDEKGEEITTALVLFNSLVPKGLNVLPPTKISYTFDKPTFIKILDPNVRMKVTSIEVTISKILTARKLLLKGEDFVQYVLRNVADGTITTSSLEGIRGQG